MDDALRKATHARKEAEAALRASEERFRRYFELGLIGMAITSPTKGWLEVNDRICEILGYDREELLRMTWGEITHPEDLAADVAAFNRVLAGEIDGYSMDKRWIRKDGRIIDSTIAVKCLRCADGSVDYFVALLQDITERKRAEEALRRAHEELEERVAERTALLAAANEQLRVEIAERKLAEEALRRTRDELAHVGRLATVGELATSLAHKLGQPLAAVVANGAACLRWLEREQPDLGEATKAAQRIVRDAQRAGDVIAHTRALVKRRGGEKDWFDVTTMIREVLVLVRPETTKHRIVVDASLAGNSNPLLGDRVQVQQVVLNLILNAIEAMADVSDRPRELAVISEHHELEGGAGVLVTVRDAGVGIAPEDVDRIFEAFYTTKPDGLGMGLAVSRSIVEAHGGRLWAGANPGHGATFRFALPYRD